MGIVAGCTNRTQGLLESQTDTELFEQGKTYYAQGKYKKALEYFEYIKEHFLRSQYAGLTRFYAGESYFATKSYAEAAIEYQSFLSFFPNDPQAPAAQYKLGLCYVKQARSPERDQTLTQKALNTLQQVQAKYPDNAEYIRKAAEQIRKVKQHLAQHEFLVALFYHNEEHYLSSNQRLAYLRQEYPGYDGMGEVLYYQGLNYVHLQQPDKAQAAFQAFIQTYPASQHVAAARQKLARLDDEETAPTQSLSLPDQTDAPSSQPTEPASSPDIPDDISGSVLMVRERTVFTDLIRDDGISENMVLQIQRDSTPIGTIRIIKIQDGFSVGEIETLLPGATIQDNDQVCCPEPR